MTTPSISVVMPVYNAERYLHQAVESILGQSFTDFELIAVDDGSRDRSKTILEKYADGDSRVRVISRANTGIVGALNDGLDASSGEFVARMDADDWAYPRRFEKQIGFMRTNPDCVCVGSYFNYMDSLGARVKWNPRDIEFSAIEKTLLKGDGGSLIHPAIMLRRAAVEKVGRYRPEAEWVEDLDLYLRLARIGTLANLPEVLLDYRYHSQSVNFTRNEGRHQRTLWVLAQAYQARGLPFRAEDFPAPITHSSVGAKDARDFAVTSLRFPGVQTSWRYALRAFRLSPTDPQSWRVLVYVAKVTMGLIPRIQ